MYTAEQAFPEIELQICIREVPISILARDTAYLGTAWKIHIFMRGGAS
jgi:hypothetical protein